MDAPPLAFESQELQVDRIHLIAPNQVGLLTPLNISNLPEKARRWQRVFSSGGSTIK
jgi:hypothetical protein